MENPGLIVFLIVVVVILLIFATCIKVVPQANAYVVERLGGYQGTWGVGVHVKLPLVDRVARRLVWK